MNAAPWKLAGTRAHLSTARIEGSIDLSRADAGLINPSAESAALGDLSLLGVNAPNLTCGSSSREPVDAYVRQNDLVATYGERDGEKRRLQIYWRVVDSEPATTEATILELVISVQTELLESHPAMHAVSSFLECEFLQLVTSDSGAPKCVDNELESRRESFLLVRPNGSDVSFMQASHPADFAGVEITSPNRGDAPREFRHPLFAEQLEKGVIRRARIRVAIVPRANDLAIATACYRRFAASEPMLTV